MKWETLISTIFYYFASQHDEYETLDCLENLFLYNARKKSV